MIVATSITESYLEKSKPFFESVNKNFKGKKICFCIGFTFNTHPWKIDGWELIFVPIENIKCKWQPKNRKDFYTLQYGEFVDYYDFKDDDQVLFLDSDMILQRPINDLLLTSKGTFFFTDSSFPAAKIKDVIQYPELGFNGDVEGFCKGYNIQDDSREFCVAFMYANIRSWRKLYVIVKSIHEKFLNQFIHHSAWQTLINIIIMNHFPYIRLNPVVCNATWYLGTKAKRENNKLMYQNSEVYFVHTKFNEEYEY